MLTPDPKTLGSLASDMDTAATGKGRYFVDPGKAKQVTGALRSYADQRNDTLRRYGFAQGPLWPARYPLEDAKDRLTPEQWRAMYLCDWRRGPASAGVAPTVAGQAAGLQSVMRKTMDSLKHHPQQFRVLADASLPPDVAELRSTEGKVLGRIVNLGGDPT
jgi:hypothetical protein